MTLQVDARVAAHASETVLYGHLAPTLTARGVCLPAPHAVEADAESHFGLFLEYRPNHSVHPGLTPTEVEAAVSALACLHSVCFGDATLLDRFDQRGCFWTSEKQDPIGPTELSESWIGFAGRFYGSGPEDEAAKAAVARAAKRLDAVHTHVSGHLASGELARQTLCHGDFKAANLLWSDGHSAAHSQKGTGREGEADSAKSITARPVIIDFEWAGPGAAAQDLAYLLLSSSPVGTHWPTHIAAYHAQLPPSSRARYPLEILQCDVEVATLDIFRWLLASRWKRITPEAMSADGASYGRVLPNRSVPHALDLSQRAVAIIESNPVVQKASMVAGN